MIKFEYENPAEVGECLSLEYVEEHQFFIDDEGYLCQKGVGLTYCTIARPTGLPMSVQHDAGLPNSRLFIVAKILPKVSKIGWE